jgi:hypothetical protein
MSQLLSGICEVDESYIGGEAKNIHKPRLAKMNKVKNYYDNKTMGLCAIERGGNVRLLASRDRATREVLHAFIKAKLADETALICTDSLMAYEGINDGNTRHEAVSHTQNEWVRGIVHANNL